MSEQKITIQSKEGSKLSIRMIAVSQAGYSGMVRYYLYELINGGLTRKQADAAREIVRQLELG